MLAAAAGGAPALAKHTHVHAEAASNAEKPGYENAALRGPEAQESCCLSK